MRRDVRADVRLLLVHQRWSAGNFYNLGNRAGLEREALRRCRANLQHNVLGLSGAETRNIHFDAVNPRGQQLESVKTCFTRVRAAGPALFLARNLHLRTFNGSVRLIRDRALKGSASGCLGESFSGAHTEKNHSH